MFTKLVKYVAAPGVALALLGYGIKKIWGNEKVGGSIITAGSVLSAVVPTCINESNSTERTVQQLKHAVKSIKNDNRALIGAALIGSGCAIIGSSQKFPQEIRNSTVIAGGSLMFSSLVGFAINQTLLCSLRSEISSKKVKPLFSYYERRIEVHFKQIIILLILVFGSYKVIKYIYENYL